MENIFLLSFTVVVSFFIAFLAARFFYLRKIQNLHTDIAVAGKELALIKADYSQVEKTLMNQAGKIENLLVETTEKTTLLETYQKELTELRTRLQKEQDAHQTLVKENQRLQNEYSSLGAELRFAQEKLQNQQQEFENIGSRFENQFKVLAGQILEEKKNLFSREQEASLKSILDPLKANLATFKQEFETKFKTESDDRISLREQVAQMMQLNQTLSVQANNLTQALRGQVKQQGNWGEMILESILEYSGLQKNMQYFVQERNSNNDGQAIQPDIRVKYPDNRNLVIDSKVSLLHYERFTATDNPQEQQKHVEQLVRSFKTHIDGLSGKQYQEIAGALDFVMMFVPVEAAYITAMQTDPQLWEYAYKKRVILISPTNLIAAMKLVNDMWQSEYTNQNAQAISERASKIYDKLLLFVEEFEKVGSYLERAHGSYTDAKKKLTTGKGNLISQAELLKNLKVKVKKDLPFHLVDEALLQDGIAFDSEDQESGDFN